MGRTTWFDVDGIKRGEWTAEEDRMLIAYINKYGVRDWGALPKRAGNKIYTYSVTLYIYAYNMSGPPICVSFKAGIYKFQFMSDQGFCFL